MDVVDEGFYGVLIFCGIILSPLGEDGVFEFGDVVFETWFLCGVGVPVSIPGSGTVGTGPSLLIHLGFVSHGNVLDIDFLCVIMSR